MFLIAAVITQIGQEVITTQDIEDFARFLSISQQRHFENLGTEEQKKLKEKALIELQRIAVQRKVAYQFLPSKKELEKALNHLAEQNHVQLSKMKDMLQKAKVPWGLFEKKIKAQLAWGNYIRQRFGNLVQSQPEKIPLIKEKEYEFYEKRTPSYEEALQIYHDLIALKTLEDKRHYFLQEGQDKGYWGWVKESQLGDHIQKTIGYCAKPKVLSVKDYRIACVFNIRAPGKGVLSQHKGTFLAITLPKNPQKDLEYDFVKRQFDATNDPKKLSDLGKKLNAHIETLKNVSFLSLNISPHNIQRLIKIPKGKKLILEDTVRGTPIEQIILVMERHEGESNKSQQSIDWGDVRLSQLSEQELHKHLKKHQVIA